MLLTKMTPILILIFFIFDNCKNKDANNVKSTQSSIPFVDSLNLKYPDEIHFKDVRQLTFGGNNAEAYWSSDGQRLCFQSDYAKWGASCDQIYYFNPFVDDLKVNAPNYVSKRGGRTTCSYFLPGDTSIIFASTQNQGSDCPAAPERKKGGKYVWAVFGSFDLFVADLKGNTRMQLTNNEYYDAEATVSPKGDKMVFTSDRSGDLELYIMDIDGRHQKQITHELGYDGGAFFSPDGTKLVFRASRPQTEEEKKEYRDLLSHGLVQPTNMEIFVCNIDGSDMKQITHLGKANWAPFFHPSGQKIIFSSNHAGTRGYEFNLYMINLDGTGLERISHDSVFDAFPMFSPDGKHLVFSSNRNNNGTHDTNLFMATWQD